MTLTLPRESSMAPMAAFSLASDSAADVCFIKSNAAFQFLLDYISVHLFSLKRCLVLIGLVGELELLPAATGRSPVHHRPQTLSTHSHQPPIN